ncbi:MAG: FG-GAP-like repeat-containing protein [Flavobacteriales bacterium]
MLKILLKISILLLPISLNAQVQIETEVPNELEICGSYEQVELKLKNEGNAQETDGFLMLSLPSGFYVEESNITGASVSANDGNGLIQLELPLMQAGDSLLVLFDITAEVSTISAQQNGDVFRITADYESSFNSASHLSEAINVLFPALNILSVTPSSQTAVTGEEVQRSINIINAGYGKTDALQLFLSDNAEGLMLTETDLGVLSAEQDMISLSSADFMGVGNGDGYLDSGETITIEQTLQLSGCNAQTITTTMNASWGCAEDEVLTVNSYSNVTISLKLPDLVVTHEIDSATCFNGDFDHNEILIENTGQGYAESVTVNIFKSTGDGIDDDIFNAIETNTVKYQVNGGDWVVPSMTEISTRNDGEYACLGSSPVGSIDFTLAESLAPDDVVRVEFDMKKCCINDCLDQGNMGWMYTVDYEDACFTQTFSLEETPEEPTELNANIFTETPVDLEDGESAWFNFMISSHDNNLIQRSNSGYFITFLIDQGLEFSGAETDMIWATDNDEWIPTSVNYDSGAGTLTGFFPLPAPFIIEKSEVQLLLIGNCASGMTGINEVSFSLSFIPDTTCLEGCEVTLICDQTVTTELHCPDPGCEGFHVTEFTAQRVNAGAPDNNLDGKPDTSGDLNEAQIRRNRLMYNDTLETVTYGYFNTGDDNESFTNFYYQTLIELGSNLSVLYAEAIIYDQSENNYTTCTDIQIEEELSGENKYFRYSLRPSSECLSLTSGGEIFQFSDGDSIEFTVRYVVSGNIGAAVQEILIDNDAFTSSFNDPWGADAPSLSSDKWGCDNYNGRITLIGFYFANAAGSNHVMRTCDKNISQNFYFSIGDCCDNYAGGNLFPYEYRNWANVSKVKITYPVDYEVNNISFKQTRSVSTNASTSQTISTIEPYHNSGGVMYFDLAQHYAKNGGSILQSDDGFNGTITLNLSPTCDVSINTYEDVIWEFTFDQEDQLGGEETDWIQSSENDQLKYRPTELIISSTDPYQDGLSRSVTWNVSLSNATSYSEAGNAWLHLKSPSNEMEIIAVLNDQGEELEMDGDIFRLGEVSTNSAINVQVVARYSSCSPDYIVAYAGFECSSYPETFSDFQCEYDTYALHVEPKDTEMQVRLTGAFTGDECSNFVELTAEIASVRFGYVDSLSLLVQGIGSEVSPVFATTQVLYGTDSNFQYTYEPVDDSGSITFPIASYIQSIEEYGLPGVTDFQNSRIKVKFQVELAPDFRTGDYIQLSFEGKAICQEDLPIINLAYDPSVQLQRNTESGLTNTSRDTWGVSWVDVDNDGFDDLFVADYNQERPNELYMNNGDGTFELSSNGPNTIGNTVSSTWGDFDNDGDQDAFLVTNVGGPNELHRNDGGGVFTKVSTADIPNYSGYCHNATWIDVDNDGNLDLFVTDYMPTKFNLLYKNEGDGSFTRIETGALVSDAGRSIGSTWADIDNDGDLDAFIPNTQGQNNCLYINDGNFQFTKITEGDIVNDGGKSVGCSWGDYNNDGLVDLFVANTGEQVDFLYTNNGDRTFSKITTGVVVTQVMNSSGSAWLDVDNDTDLDLLVTADLGHASSLYINNGDGTFSVQANEISSVLGNSYPTAASDVDKDGDIDIFVGNRSDEQNAFFENNRANCNSWLCVNLEGVISNKNAYGARVMLKSVSYGEEVWQSREVSSQSGGGAGSQSSRSLLFGLGDAISVDSVVVYWPSGIVSRFDSMDVNDCLFVQEEEGEKLCGIIYNDENGNCIFDAEELPIPGVVIKELSSGLSVVSDLNGQFEYWSTNDQVTLSVELGTDYTTACGSSTTVDLSTLDGSCGLNFGLVSECETTDLSTSLGHSVLRRGFTNQITLNYENHGVELAEQTELRFDVSNAIHLVSATVPWDSEVQGDETRTYIWNLGDVGGYEFNSIQLIDSVDVWSEIDELVTMSLLISSSGEECNLEDNSYSISDVIVGSVDPNDKHVTSSNNDFYQVTSEDWLHYKIRFQNVGNYYATRIVVVDTLSELLDLSTIEFLGQSHDLPITMNENVITWSSNNTFLPDSISDEEGSHGYMNFKIRPKSGDDLKGIISNKASIQFDFNEYIVTNTVHKNLVNSLEGENLVMVIHPNPSSGSSKVSIKSKSLMDNSFAQISEIDILDSQGTLVKRQSALEPYVLALEERNLVKGMYVLKATLSDGIIVFGKWLVTE